MSIQTLINRLINAGIEENEAKCEVKLLLKHFCNYTQEDFIKGKELSDDEKKTLNQKITIRVEERLPVQYIIGEAWFMGAYYKVTPDVLIPRDETELLARKAIQLINENDFYDVLDIGTGSGCIACSIAKDTKALVLGVDISSDALRIALDNVTRLGLNNRAIFRKSDLFSGIRDGESFDLIVSNPPYIPNGTILSPEVLHEPSIALFAKENGHEYYRKIIEKAPYYLNDGGYLLFELGIDEAEHVRKMMIKDFTEIKIEEDFAGIARIIYGKYRK